MDITYVPFIRNNGDFDKVDEKLTEWMVSAYADGHPGGLPLGRYPVSKGLQETWVAFMIAYHRENPVGFITLICADTNRSVYTVGYAYVQKGEYRKKGIWKELSEQIEDMARGLGAIELEREIQIGNEFLIDYLEQRGYCGDGFEPLRKRL